MNQSALQGLTDEARRTTPRHRRPTKDLLPMPLMIDKDSDPSGFLWTGPLMLELRNGANCLVDDADLTIGRDTVQVRHENRCLAVMDRDVFRQWLFRAEPEPLAVDDVVWSVQIGSTWMSNGSAMYRVAPDSLQQLVGVI